MTTLIQPLIRAQRAARWLFWTGLWYLGRGVRWVWVQIKNAFWALVLLIAARRARRFRGGQRLYWGPDPLPNIDYWSAAMAAAGFESHTVVREDADMLGPERFDRYHSELVAESRLPSFLARRAADYVVFLRVLREFDIAHLSFLGGPLGWTPLAALEPRLFRLAGIRTVMIPFGGDFWRFSWVLESLMRHAFLIDYPEEGRNEDVIDRRVKRWMKHADIVVGGLMVEGASRWDVLATNCLVVSPDRVTARSEWSDADGRSASVRIVHAPNHRGVKGTEFILDAIERLKGEGHEIELVLLEGRSNDEVLAEMRRGDICIDHCIGSGYGMFAVEAMGSGTTVIANLEDEQRIGVHRHFGWLAQCPIVSANIDQLAETIEHLIVHPELREELGRMGIEYVRRFHSPQTAQYLFGSIYRSLAGDEVDLMRLFHPLVSDYMRRFEPIEPPLQRNRPLALASER